MEKVKERPVFVESASRLWEELEPGEHFHCSISAYVVNKLRQKRLSGVFQSIGIKIEPSPRQFATAFIDKNAGNN